MKKRGRQQPVLKAREYGVGAALDFSPFYAMCAELQRFRVDVVIREMERHQERGRILAFVRGLRLSAQLIYVLRERLKSPKVEVDWGHILHRDQIHCSPECDVIIHSGSKHRWNGNEKPVMDFNFVESDKALAVISCKSFIKDVDDDYPKRLRDYLKNVFLFAECCERSDVDRLARSARRAGYKGFYYLYLWDPNSSYSDTDPRVWEKFLSDLKAIITR